MTNLTIVKDVKKSVDKKELDDLPPLVRDEKKVKEKKKIKTLTSNKLLARILVSLAQIKVGNISYKLRNGIR